MFNSGLLDKIAGSSKCVTFDCATFKIGKSKTLSFPTSTSRSSKCFELVHNDVWGIAPYLSQANYIYFVTFIN